MACKPHVAASSTSISGVHSFVSSDVNGDVNSGVHTPIRRRSRSLFQVGNLCLS